MADTAAPTDDRLLAFMQSPELAELLAKWGNCCWGEPEFEAARRKYLGENA